MEQMIARLPQMCKIAALLFLFLLVPFLPPSIRAPYLYLLFNTLVVALGVQAGFLSVSGRSNLTDQPPPAAVVAAVAAASAVTTNHHLVTSQPPIMAALPEPREVNSSHAACSRTAPSEILIADRGAIKNMVDVAKKLKETIRKVPSRASIFFIGSADPHDDGEVVDATSTLLQSDQAKDVQKRYGDLMSKQELFTKADAFIGNFYMQLKMQREQSWNKLQDLYSHSHHHHYKAKAF